MEKNYAENIEYLDSIFEKCDDIKCQEIELTYMNNRKGKIYYPEEAVNDITMREVIFGLTDVERLDSIEQIITTIMTGNAVLLVEEENYALKIRSKGYPGIGVSEAKNEQVIRGSDEGFSTSYKTNESLVRKRIRNPELKIEEMHIGVRSKTGVALVYMDTIVRKELISEVKRRLSDFTIDGLMDSGVIEQLTNDNEYSPFPQYMTTERPDRVAQLVLDGHIVLLVDNTPVALALPVNFATFLKAADDYFSRWEFVTLERILRYIAMFFAFSLPALYISVVNFHPEILPLNLVLIFIKTRENIPYPVFVEVFLMEIAFELIREAGVRIPGAMGNAIGIVGGLIVGSAAVEANLASPIVVIVVALTALCSFTIPNNEFSSAFRIIKYFLIIFSGLFGIYGYILGVMCVLIHLSGLSSYGFPYLGPVAAGDMGQGEGEKDFIFRAPFKFLTRRPVFAKDSNRRKQRVYKK